jgi:hypothetical protein
MMLLKLFEVCGVHTFHYITERYRAHASAAIFSAPSLQWSYSSCVILIALKEDRQGQKEKKSMFPD